MKHSCKLEGYCFRLRPIERTDAQTIIDLRCEDMKRNQYIHAISGDVGDQEAWLESYFQREGDYYFVIENRLSGEAEGLIAFYDVSDGRAEWGRWVIRKGSLAAAESVWLLYRIAFEQVGLRELYCRTVADNATVVSFHTSIGERTRAIHKNIFEINGIFYDAVEQYSDREHFYETVAPVLEKQAKMVLHRSLKGETGGLVFHHIGVAVRRIEKELPLYTLMGYEKEGACFEDAEQGVRGLFLTAKGQPRLELLENLPGSHTLDVQLKNHQKMYHMAYLVKNIEKAAAVFLNNRAKIISPMKESAYFGKRICFLVLPDMMMVELIEA